MLVEFDVLTYNVRGLGDEPKGRKSITISKRTRQENLIQGSPYILNYYGPNDESSQFNALQLFAEKLQTVNVDDNCQFILAGDWNLIFYNSLMLWKASPTLNPIQAKGVFRPPKGFCP